MRRQTTLVARDRELLELSDACTTAASGEGRFLMLAGEAGVGKTRLANAGIAASGLACLRGAAPARGSTPYAPIVAALRSFLQRHPDGLSGGGRLLAPLGVLLPELQASRRARDRETLADAIRVGFETVGRAAPTIVFLDDLQWADAATLELIPALAEAAEHWPLLLLGAHRNDEIPRGHPLRRLRSDLRRAGRLHELVLEPLGPPATAALAAEILGGQPSPALGAALYDRTQGVPFFVEEFAAALKNGARLTDSPRGLELADGSSLPLPETIREAVRLRTDGLSPRGRASLEAAAAIGGRIELELLSALDCDTGLEELLERELLQEAEPGTGAFRHDLTREAVSADTAWPRRRALHRTLAGLLETRGVHPSLVAEHWLAGGEPSRARPRLLEAARRFCDMHAYRDAAAAARTSLELWPAGEDEPGRLKVLDQLGRCAELCGELAEAQQAWEEVAAGLEGSRDLRRRAIVAQKLATVYELQGAWTKAAAAHAEAGDRFEDLGRPADAASEWFRAAEAHDDVVKAMELLERARAAAALADRRDLELRCLSSRGFWLAKTGRQEEGFAAIRSAVSQALADHQVDAAVDAYWALGALADAWSDYESAQTAFEEAVELCQTQGKRAEEAFCLSCLAVVLRHRGEWAQAEKLSREVLESSVSSNVGKTHALLTLGHISAARGSTKRAQPLLSRGLALAREIGLQGSTVDGEIGLGLVDELEGRPSAYWDGLANFPPELLAGGYAPGLATASTFAARRNDAPLVHACAEALAKWALRFGNAGTLGALAHCLGEVALLDGQAERAAEHFSQALERLTEVDAPFERAGTQKRAGLALAASGERELGVEMLTSAYRTFRKLGARPYAVEVAADLQGLGEKVDQRLGRRAAGDLERGGLTPRELEILRLVAVGRTNREIAKQLFLSPRTVDMHVRNMFAKLGCRSRAEATGRAHELHLIEPVQAGGALPAE
jgi:DNA-binding CsgD family transcriptional regulator